MGRLTSDFQNRDIQMPFTVMGDKWGWGGVGWESSVFVMCLRYPSGEVIGRLGLKSKVQAGDTRWEPSACNGYPQLREWLTSPGEAGSRREKPKNQGLGHWRQGRKHQWGLGGAASKLGGEAGRWGGVSWGSQEECLGDKKRSACQMLRERPLGRGLRTDHWI